MKHTKGKWEVAGQDPDIYIESGLKTLCKLWGRGEEQEANAELIAAAPDLLEALLKAKELIKEWHNIGAGEMGDGLWAIYDSKSPEMKRINEAIKKATHESSRS